MVGIGSGYLIPAMPWDLLRVCTTMRLLYLGSSWRAEACFVAGAKSMYASSMTTMPLKAVW